MLLPSKENLVLRKSACIASLVGALVVSAPAVATSPKGGRSSSIALVQPSPHYGDAVTFTISTTVTDQPWVNLKCYQGGTLVAEGWDGFFAGALGDRLFGLYSPAWTGGAADCTAWLVDYANGRWKQLASTSFHVDA